MNLREKIIISGGFLLVLALSLVTLNNNLVLAVGGESLTETEPVGTMEISELCSNIDDSTGKCASCASSGGLWTAIGCLPTNVETLAPKLISIILGIAGLLLTIRILIAGAQIIFSAGDSNALNKARTSIINSVIALLFIIFGATFLQIIGVKIFDIPGFFQ